MFLILFRSSYHKLSWTAVLLSLKNRPNALKNQANLATIKDYFYKLFQGYLEDGDRW